MQVCDRDDKSLTRVLIKSNFARDESPVYASSEQKSKMI